MLQKCQRLGAGLRSHHLVIPAEQSFQSSQVHRFVVNDHDFVIHILAAFHRVSFVRSISGFASTGIEIVKVVPLPGALVTSILPPCRWMMLCEIDKPSPVPSPTGFVVKKGSKILFTFSGAIPTPVSLNVATT